MEKDLSIFMAIFIVFLCVNFRINGFLFSLTLYVAQFYTLNTVVKPIYAVKNYLSRISNVSWIPHLILALEIVIV